MARNVAVGFLPGERELATSVNAASVVAGMTYHTTLSATPLFAAPAFVSGAQRGLETPVVYLENDGFGVTDFGEFVRPDPWRDSPIGREPVLQPIFSYHDGVPALLQGTNECVPTAFANSIAWLNQEHDLGLSGPEVIRDLLKGPLYMMTSPERGTTIAQALAGKDAYVRDRSLPIVTKRIDNTGAGYLTNLITAMQHGEDVEMFIKFLSGAGHAITLIGINRLDDTTASVTFQDPAYRKPHESKLWVTDTGQIFLDFGATVELTVEESVVPEPGSLVLTAVGLGMLVLAYRRRRRALAAQW